MTIEDLARSGDVPASESPMALGVVGSGGAPASGRAPTGAPTGAPDGPGGTDPADADRSARTRDDVTRRPAGWLVVVLALMAVGVGALVLLGRDDPPVAVVEDGAIPALHPAPAVATVQRWTLDLEFRDRVALADDRVVVADDPFPEPAGEDVVLRAHHLRSKHLLWERRLAAPAVVVLVHADGRLTLFEDPHGYGVDRSDARLVGVAVADGRVLWDRPGPPFVSPGPPGSDLLLPGDEGCDLVDPGTGETTWQAEEAACVRIDAELVAVSSASGWDVVDPGGGTLVRLPGEQPPVATGDLLVAMTRDGTVVARGRDGSRQWRRETGVVDGSLSAAPGLGVIARAWDDDGEPRATRALDTRGRDVELGDGWDPDGSIAVRFGSRRLALDVEWVGLRGTVEVRDLDHPDEVLARIDRRLADPPPRAITDRGVLVVDGDGPRLALLRWPDLEEAWSVRLPDAADTALDARPATILSSASGMLVITHASGRAGVVHAFS